MTFEGMKVLRGLSKLLSAEAVPSEKKTNEEQQPVVEDGKEAVEIHVKTEMQVEADVAPATVPKQDGNVPAAAAEKVILEAKSIEKQLQGSQGTYIVGGSPMGWNFLIYPGSEPVYYGVTREAARLRRSAA
ncbi:hypothetical protein Taro_040608 [Colocasia esculenta]|uniref:Uncharacterized protein n=1 Tax=Colocasia esculenta TaxID=4460 RepID=A0A843WTI9_COLES|nr:hypothetical protein [Colocasia esculenta]